MRRYVVVVVLIMLLIAVLALFAIGRVAAPGM